MLNSRFLLLVMIALSSTAAFASDDPEMDAFVRKGADIRSSYWQNLKTFQPVALKSFEIDEVDDLAIRRGSMDPRYENTILYNVTLPARFVDSPQDAKPYGVVIQVYGGSTKQNLNDNPLSEANILASQGYIVYSLNLRGTQDDYGDAFVNDLAAAHGIQSLIRDTTYFANLFKLKEGDINGRRPLFADLVLPDIPIFLTGASFGGYLSLHHATNPEEKLRFHPKRGAKEVAVGHKDTIDAYIPKMASTNVHYDIKSQTTTAKVREPFFNNPDDPSLAWMRNVYQHYNALKSKEDNEFLSPSEHTGYLEKPVFIVHNIMDDNNSPKHAINFREAANQNGRGQFVGASYSPSLGHASPQDANQAQAYYEPILKFMDAVRFKKWRHQKFTFNQQQQHETAEISKAANFRMRVLHPTLHRPQEQLIYKIALQYLNQNKIAVGQPLDPEHLSKSFDRLIENFPQEFLKAVLYLTRKDRFKTKETFGEKTLEILKERNRLYAQDIEKLNINSVQGPLSTYLNSTIEIVPTSTEFEGEGENRVDITYAALTSTPYDELKSHMGNGDDRKGSQIFKYQKNRLKMMFLDILQKDPKALPLYFTTVDHLATSF